MLNIILGPANAGQSGIMCRRMVGSSVDHPSSSFIIIVPEQSTLKMQRDVVAAHPHHAVMNIDVVSFERLSHRVFEEMGIKDADLLNDTGKVLILRKILEEVRDDLLVYKRKVHMPGFASEMKSVLTELRQYDIDDNDLFLMQEAAAGEGNRMIYEKLQDIRLVYRKFDQTIEEKYTTREEQMDLFADLVKDSGIIRGSHIYLDGFTGFTPVQYRLIREMLMVAEDITVTVTLPESAYTEEPDDYDIFALSNRTLNKLKMIAEETGSDISTEYMADNRKTPRILVKSCYDIHSEVMFAAEKILDGVRNEGRRFRDYAVVLSDMEAYRNVVADIFKDAGISVFIDHKYDLSGNMLARFIVCAVEVIRDRFSYASLFAYLKSGLTDIYPDDICKIENYCLEFGIRGYSAFKREFSLNRRLKGHNEEDEYYWDLEKINNIRTQILKSISEFYESLRASENRARDYSEALKKLLETNNAEEKIHNISEEFYEREDPASGKEYEQIYGHITELLDSMKNLLADEMLSPAAYGDILAGAMEEIKVSIIPPALDACLAGDLTRTRFDETRTLFILGANDGKLPGVKGNTGLFTQREREFLKKENFELAPSPLEDLYIQYFYIYLMLGKPSEELYFTWSLSGTEGEELSPSVILSELDGMLPGIEAVKADDTGDMIWRKKAVDILAGAVRDRRKEGRTILPDEKEQQLLAYFAKAEPEVLRQILSGAFYTNKALPIDEQTVIDLYGDRLKGSASRYEQYSACPFRHFLNYGLDIQKRPEYEVQATDIGTIYHESLELYAARLKERGLSFRSVSDEESHRIINECMEEAALNMESDSITDTERNAFLLKRMGTVAEKTTDVLRMQVKQGLYEPELFEFPFSTEIDDSVVFSGKIDRVDIYDGDDVYVKVIDYKSGNKKFSIRDIYTGQQLQLVAYLSAAVKKAGEDHPGRNIKVGGVYYYLINDRFVRDDESAAKKYRMSGLTGCDPEAVRAIDTSLKPGQSSMIAEIGFTKDKALSSRSKAADQREFEGLMNYTGKKIRSIAEEIRKGNVTISPQYEKADKNACIYCDYKNICKFEPGKWGSDHNRLPEDMDEDRIKEEIYGSN